MRNFVGLLLLVLSNHSLAQVYGPSVEERRFTIEAHFESQSNDEDEWLEEAGSQFSHIFGVFHSPKVISSFGLDPVAVGGVGAPLLPATFSGFSGLKQNDGTYLVSYKARGRILLHRKVAQKLDRQGEMRLPLPVKLADFYDVKCTDAHYDSFDDFWYFFDPFRRGCEYLSKAPLADEFTLKLGESVQRKLDTDVRLDLVRGNNGNGETFRIDVYHGFNESTDDSDEGRQNFEALGSWLNRQGFSRTEMLRFQNRPLNRYSKELKLSSGKKIKVEVRTMLVETSIGSRNISFAKYFKDSVENADVLFYAGHSGLGGNLDLESLESKAGGFKFNPNKRQIFYFDSCSSYSYYLYPFRSEKTRARLDIVTNGLSSYFETGPTVLSTFLSQLLDPKVEDVSWEKVLSEIEEALEGHSYLTNVGGI